MNDTTSDDNPALSRRRWMAILARAQAGPLQNLLETCGSLPNHALLRGPEGGLVMVRGRAGGGGGAFNLGEMTVTRCTVRTEAGLVGHAYIPGRDARLAELAAFADALLQDPDYTDTVERRVISPLEHQQAQQRAERASKAAATRVEFFAMQTMRS